MWQGEVAMAEVRDELVREAIAYLDEVLDEHAVAYVHLDRGELIERIERIRESAVAARTVLAERRSFAAS
jgi:hypothetical protein